MAPALGQDGGVYSSSGLIAASICAAVGFFQLVTMLFS
jgi:hypothetical protein